MSKRLHEIANYDPDIIQQSPDFCPVQDTANKEDSKSCAECKDFKTHRVYNALMVIRNNSQKKKKLTLYIVVLYCTWAFFIYKKGKTNSYNEKNVITIYYNEYNESIHT
jgi:hypothetical protein